MTKLNLLILLLFASLLFGQTKFDQKELMLLQDIYHNSGQKNINDFMKGKGYAADEVKNNEYGYYYSFISESKEIIDIEYNKERAIVGIALLSVFDEKKYQAIEKSLKDRGFTPQEFEEMIQKENILSKEWTKNGQTQIFTTSKIYNGKFGFLHYTLYEE